MNLIILHHHFRPGGVRRVIELATPHLVAHWPEPIRAVTLATGEAPDPEWLRAFRASLPGTPVKVFLEPLLGYLSELPPDRRKLEERVGNAVLRMVQERRRDECLVWAHNLGLGRNLYLARALTQYSFCFTLVAHHHDWWFDNRWHHFAALREPGFRKLDAIANAILDAAPSTLHVAINQAEAEVLGRHFPAHAGWLPNLVERRAPPSAARLEAVREWLQAELGDSAPVWLLPCRLLRRKNLGEALLLTRWLRPEAWLVTTGGPSSAEEQPYAEALAAAAQHRGWRLRLGLLHGREQQAPSVPELFAASEAVLVTSLQEGFGLPCLEAAAAQRPLLVRSLPNIAPDLARFGFTFPQSYRELLVDPSLFDWEGEHERQTGLFAEWKRLMPESASDLVGQPALLAAGKAPAPVPFSRLTLTAQLQVLAQPPEVSWERCAALNRFLRTWRNRLTAGPLEVSPWPRTASRWLGGAAYAQRFLELLPSWDCEEPGRGAGHAAQTELLRKKLRAENLYPLLWNIRT